MENMVIPILIEDKVKRYAYLIHRENGSILIDPGSKHHIPILLESLKSHIKISDISYIILQSNDYLNLSSLDDLNQRGFKGQLIVNESGVPYLNDMLDNKLISISSINYKLKIADKLTLEFIPIPFLPFPECFMTVFKEEGILFSSHLFSQKGCQSEHLEKLILSINQFHENIMPSVEFVRQAIKKLKKYNLILIYPRLGCALKNTMIPDVYAKVLAYDFYNSNQVVEYKNDKNVSFNYETICNHMLKRLESKYHRATILDVFKDSDIHLDLYPHIEIESTKLKDYKLWNDFFDIIYQKKSISWLMILEPIVKKYHNTHHIELPTIYKTSQVEQALKIADLNLEKTHLKEKVLELSSKISETTDKLLRCEITDLYNQKFMIGHLLNNLDKPLKENHVRGLILVHIDNLLAINKKYGTHKGNETLRNLVHLMQNIKTEDTVLFKQTGPGIYVYKHDIEEKALTAFALNLSKQVKKSDLFIEDITITISITTADELNNRYPLDERVNQFIELSQMRLERAKLKGKAQILDKYTDEDTYTEGIILLVDEDETYQNLMARIFDRIHYKLIMATDIYEAYEQLETHNVDIIISEINLSKLDGFQLKQKINESLTFKNIPFIMVSHLKNLEVVTRCNMLDIDLILQKPMIPDELIGHIKRIRDKKVKL
jgi:diguanylate cyclase (GGDEF)-like protein